MKEKPINLKDEEVRLLLAGATLLVVPVSHQPEVVNEPEEGFVWCFEDGTVRGRHRIGDSYTGIVDIEDRCFPTNDAPIKAPCLPGDVLWVREGWAQATDFGYATDHIFYRATYINGGPYDDVKRWRPAQHMPRELVRPELSHIPVAKVEACQVQGMLPAEVLAMCVDYEQHSIGLGSPCDEIRMLQAFQNHFDTLYPGAWDNNLWVWKIWRDK